MFLDLRPFSGKLVGISNVGLLGMGLVGLLALEQMYRNEREERSKALHLLCLGAGMVFVADIVVYSQAALLGAPILELWGARGLANAAAAVGSNVVRALGGSWAERLEPAFLAVALPCLVGMLFSVRLRARAKVFLVKHFHRNKYDYRREWLQRTNTLSRAGDSLEISRSALEGLSRIVGSRSGSLWTATSRGRYELAARTCGDSTTKQGYDAQHPTVEFLRTEKWVIDSDEYLRHPARYGRSFGDLGANVLLPSSFIVPLDCQGHLQGFAILEKPKELATLNFEDHDILKTAGRQIAVVLSQVDSPEQLLATRQFEAVNKLATSFMHDMNSLVAQQELVLANAQRFRDRQELVDDAIAIIRAATTRMRKMLDELESAAQGDGPPQSRGRDRGFDGSALALRIGTVGSLDSAIWMDMDRDQLASVLTQPGRASKEWVLRPIRCEK